MPYLKIPGFRKLPQTGVIYVMQRAAEKGWKAGDPLWSNLGQGAPEAGVLDGAPKRVENLNIPLHLHEYSPTSGQLELRQKVADLYNYRYRQGKSSQYTWENVSISGGGRIALTRIAASMGSINMGHFIPDYTAYEELLGVFKAFVPIPIIQDVTCGYQVSLEHIKQEITGRGLSAVLLSNPCNPTGQVIAGNQLQQLVELGRDYNCSLILDEFYSHYIYTDVNVNSKYPTMISAAKYVEDVNNDPVIIIDGLTKNWRYPGWRISWTVAPKDVIQVVTSAGSFLDGGANNMVQQQALSLLEPEYVIQETKALQACFAKKRDYMLNRLIKMGIKVEKEPQGTFYIWANLSGLPAKIADGFKFLEAGLEEKVITVPGIFFDVNPEKRRTYARFHQYSRISFGPAMDELTRGLDAIERVIKRYK
ncbi:Pyridoxal phosphate-dependent aminotransferase [Candidatus Trichorickettsia mobilis]|uniref:aspartate transaminase n=1 Tax=Candidatus Trichorickettsia mobilis TaxID=1346319 RepID=A0ABZ0UUK4_9RICK|nr:pyridoxal phosphate-dependent aminotransferase [Candidatus Trichorickettsia mobilis]WPY01181.1 Pyridoxal phosphate-dependent aminotransferase [Candidatus Trichorickettsia mobilis]